MNSILCLFNVVDILKSTLLLLHGFNSAPGAKKEAIAQWLQSKYLDHTISLIAPELPISPTKAIGDIEDIIKLAQGKVYVIGTSLGGFYANYIRAIYPDSKCVVHAINPSWQPSKTLQRVANKEVTNYKTGAVSFFSESYIADLAEMETEVIKGLKNYTGNAYYLHIGTQDELLAFDGLFEFLKKHNISHQKYEYPTNHRFEMMPEMLKVFGYTILLKF